MGKHDRLRGPCARLHAGAIPRVPEAFRGTYAGHGERGDHRILAVARRDAGRAAARPHLRRRQPPARQRAEELLGLQHDRVLRTVRGATRPTADFAFAEFKEMVAQLHDAGLEVILDVVYNHTAEGNELGPTLSFKGIDNASYYRLAPDARYYINDTGTGNTVNLSNSRVLQMVMDSLRYWAQRHARRRLPFRPRHHPRSRAARLRGGRPLPRCLPAGPGAVGGQADRRTLGSRTGRLPGRTVLARVGRVE